MNFDLISLLMGLGAGVLLMLVLFTWSRGGIHRAEAEALRGELAAVRASAAQKQAEANTQISHLQGQVAETNGQIGSLRSQLEEANGQIGSLQQALADCQAQQAAPEPEPEASAESAEVVEVVAEPAPAAVASADAPPAAPTAVAETPADTGEAQDLKMINGVGGTYEKRLNKAGILNFAHLGAQTAEQLQDIIKPQAWQTIDFGTWIEEARLFATNPALLTSRIVELPNLNAIEAQQLYEAGIRSLADLAAQSEERLRELITPTDPAKFNPAEWVEDAKRLLG